MVEYWVAVSLKLRWNACGNDILSQPCVRGSNLDIERLVRRTNGSNTGPPPALNEATDVTHEVNAINIPAVAVTIFRLFVWLVNGAAAFR